MPRETDAKKDAAEQAAIEAKRKEAAARAQARIAKAQASVAEAKARAAQAEERVYEVQPGDSLSKIAKQVYGDASRWPEIFQANKDQIKDPNLIHPGQKLRIP